MSHKGTNGGRGWISSLALVIAGVGIGIVITILALPHAPADADPLAFAGSLVGAGITVAASFAVVERQLSNRRSEKRAILKDALEGVRTRLENFQEQANGKDFGDTTYEQHHFLITREVKGVLAIRDGNPPEDLATHHIYLALRRVEAVEWEKDLRSTCLEWTMMPGKANKTEAITLTENVTAAISMALQQIAIY